ncbi:LysR family transcriptional regulator [Marinomonas algicola]|uniref:LysR family transcriptional regulator n=1 Tax=Marinomonas algicola TaxID=2773454 RepID=UPI00174B6AF5|nr:LysR family transcriptional regulator [Marinomonas algicola]
MNAITLDQFMVFLTVIDEKSFAGAARKLSRTQSAITYAIQKLEEQSDLLLFDRSTYRPTLTDAGRSLLPRIRRVMDDVGDFRLHVQSMAQGIEAELNVVLDNFLPLSLITPALDAFYDAFPMVPVRISAVWTQEARQSLVDKRADLGVFLRMPGMPAELENKVVSDIDLVLVVAPHHPLANVSSNDPSKAPSKVSQHVLRDHLQIVVSNQDSYNFGLVGVNQWKVSEMRLRYELIMAGLGWGSMPRQMIEKEVSRGELIILEPEQWDSSNKMPSITALVAKRKDKAMGPAATFLMDEIARKRLYPL